MVLDWVVQSTVLEVCRVASPVPWVSLTVQLATAGGRVGGELHDVAHLDALVGRRRETGSQTRGAPPSSREKRQYEPLAGVYPFQESPGLGRSVEVDVGR